MSCKANYSTFRASHIYKEQKHFVVVTYGLTLTLTRRAIIITRFLIYSRIM
jgi:hypothetical protein